MRKFEAYISLNGITEITTAEPKTSFTLESQEGYEFGEELLKEISSRYPTMIKAVEQHIKLYNNSLFAVIKQNRRQYVLRVVHIILSCCFGELDHELDFDGTRFKMEYPRQCRCQTFCPWNGYADRNKDSFMVICGAKREFGFTPQERRVLHLIQSGTTNSGMIADVMQLTKSSIQNFMNRIYKRTGTTNLAELINLVKDERI